MNGSQPYLTLVFMVLLAVLAIAAKLWLRRRRAVAPAPAAGRHRGEPEYVVWHDEGSHGFTVWYAPDVALISDDLVTRARNGNTPELEYHVRESDVHLVVLGAKGSDPRGAGRVVYKLGGRSSDDPQSFHAVRVA